MRSSLQQLLFLFLLLPFSLQAQYYNTGQDPASLKWKLIRTERFDVIYPETYGKGGAEFAQSLENSWSGMTQLYPDRKMRIPVVIHNHTTKSNGYVAWAPSRMEIFPTPEQNSIPLDPNTQLAIHELTHVMQLKSLNTGLTRAMSLLTGEQFNGAVSSLLPLWFLEGDAVFAESVLTESGRGRTPSFQKQLKALMLEKGTVYSYDKSVNGSFRDYVPDHYQYGYQMMAWSYLKYDPGMWKKAVSLTGSVPFTINPVNLSLRRSASLTKARLFRETFDSLATIWKSDDSDSERELYGKLNPLKKGRYINYYSPLSAGADSIIAIKTSLTDPPAFVLIRPSLKSEKKIHVPGDGYPWSITFGSGKLCWVETYSDPRWQNREWRIIKVMDIRNRKVKQLSFRSRYMSASVSNDGNFIAASENSPDNRNSLVIIDAWNGDMLETIPVPGNAYLQRPRWDPAGTKIAVITLTADGEGIIAYDRVEKKWEKLMPEGNIDIQSADIRGDSLFFVSSLSGTDNLYLQKPDKSVVPLTNSRFGINDPEINGDRILFSDYSSSGSNICQSLVSSGKAAEEIPAETGSFLINRLDEPEKVKVKSDEPADYTPVSYRKWKHLFRFHSWMPFYADLDAIQDDPLAISPGFTILSQNNLSTLISTFGYEYSDNRHKFHSGVKWSGRYIQFESGFDFGDIPYIERFGENVADPPNVINAYQLVNSATLPLIFRGGSFTKYLYLEASSNLSNNYIFLKSKGAYDTYQNQLTGRLYFSNYSRSAFRDIYPGWAQTFDINYSFHPFDKEIYGDILSARTAFYFPGLFKNNGLKVRLEAERQNPELFILRNRIAIPRGYEEILSPDLKFASADYFMPLLYPDLNIPGLLFLTRIRGDIFYDYAVANSYYAFTSTPAGTVTEFVDGRKTFSSFGAELVSDFYLFRIPFMISAGVQASWKQLGDIPDLSFLMSVDLFGMSIGRERSRF